jgi:abortive infection bacteriophage resistance protein
MISRNFTKTHLSYQQQIELLESRGLLISDKAPARKKLEHIGYYRLSAYYPPFQNEKDRFGDGTRFEEVLRLYYFDKALRKIIFDAIETIEINVRANVAYNLSRETEAFGYMEKSNLHISYADYFDLMQTIQRETRRSREAFVTHFKHKYHSDILPVWTVVEIISFATLSKFFKALKPEHETLTEKLDIPPKVLKNWLHMINHVRNICAHHGRLWNKQFVIKGLIPKKVATFHGIRNDKIFMLILMLRYMFKKLDTAAGFREKIEALLLEYPEIDTASMGFPEDWKERLR